MTSPNTGQNIGQRWYEQQSKISVAVQLVLKFPQDLQEIIFKGVDKLVEREFKVSELKNEYKTLGHKKVLAIYKSKQKKRDYDQNPVIHKGMNQLMLLSEADQSFVASQIIKLLDLLKTYLSAQPSVTAINKEVEQITGVYVIEGEEAATALVKQFVQSFLQEVDKKAESSPHSGGGDKGEKISGTDTDMKISSDM